MRFLFFMASLPQVSHVHTCDMLARGKVPLASLTQCRVHGIQLLQMALPPESMLGNVPIVMSILVATTHR